MRCSQRMVITRCGSSLTRVDQLCCSFASHASAGRWGPALSRSRGRDFARQRVAGLQRSNVAEPQSDFRYRPPHSRRHHTCAPVRCPGFCRRRPRAACRQAHAVRQDARAVRRVPHSSRQHSHSPRRHSCAPRSGTRATRRPPRLRRAATHSARHRSDSAVEQRRSDLQTMCCAERNRHGQLACPCCSCRNPRARAVKPHSRFHIDRVSCLHPREICLASCRANCGTLFAIPHRCPRMLGRLGRITIADLPAVPGNRPVLRRGVV